MILYRCCKDDAALIALSTKFIDLGCLRYDSIEPDTAISNS